MKRYQKLLTKHKNTKTRMSILEKLQICTIFFMIAKFKFEELLRTNVLDKDDINDLLDLKYSIKEDGKSQNIELLSSLLETAKETIKDKSILLHEKAKIETL